MDQGRFTDLNAAQGQSMRNLAFMGASTAIRLVFGLLTFGLMARWLGAADFGRFMAVFAASTLGGLVANFGLATYVLREVGAATADDALQIMREVLTAKLMLVVVVLAAAAILVPWLPTAWHALLGWMVLAQVLDAVTDLLNVGFRATGRYASETRIATASSLLQFALIAGTLATWPTPVAAASAYCAARALVLAMTWTGQRAYFGAIKPAGWRSGVVRLRQAKAYAADFGLQSLFGQIDSIVILHYFGAAAVGLYQAGMRLFLGGAQAASVLGNVAIPKLSAMPRGGDQFDTAARQVQLAFLAVGLGGACVFASLPASAVARFLGPDFLPLMSLLPWFGLLFVIRFSASSTGVLLTAIGKQTSRARLTAVHWLVAALVAMLVLPSRGLQGWLWALIAANAVLSAGYMVILLRSKAVRLGPLPFMVFTAGVAGLAFNAAYVAPAATAVGALHP
jgi:O-antigen/teichoic acid export membrane protein